MKHHNQSQIVNMRTNQQQQKNKGYTTETSTQSIVFHANWVQWLQVRHQ